MVGWKFSAPLRPSAILSRLKSPSASPIESKNSRSLELGSLELGSRGLGIVCCSLQSVDPRGPREIFRIGSFVAWRLDAVIPHARALGSSADFGMVCYLISLGFQNPSVCCRGSWIVAGIRSWCAHLMGVKSVKRRFRQMQPNGTESWPLMQCFNSHDLAHRSKCFGKFDVQFQFS